MRYTSALLLTLLALAALAAAPAGASRPPAWGVPTSAFFTGGAAMFAPEHGGALRRLAEVNSSSTDPNACAIPQPSPTCSGTAASGSAPLNSGTLGVLGTAYWAQTYSAPGVYQLTFTIILTASDACMSNVKLVAYAPSTPSSPLITVNQNVPGNTRCYTVTSNPSSFNGTLLLAIHITAGPCAACQSGGAACQTTCFRSNTGCGTNCVDCGNCTTPNACCPGACDAAVLGVTSCPTVSEWWGQCGSQSTACVHAASIHFRRVCRADPCLLPLT